MKIVKPTVTMLHSTKEPEKAIEFAGRVCYASRAGITKDSSYSFVNMLKDSKHESVLEHAYASFNIVCDRAIANELVRHRLASYSQESTRYCNYSKDRFTNEIKVIRPSGLNECALILWELACLSAEHGYLDMLNYVKPEIARSVLPMCLATEIVMTCNFREWLHFLKLRTGNKAHPDMRIIANLIANSLVAIAPTVFQEYAK